MEATKNANEQEKNAQEVHDKKKKIKLEWDSETIRVLMDKLNEDKETYLLALTNYTCLIETEDYHYHFMKHLQRPTVFAVSNQLKRYMDTTLQKIDTIDRDKMKYYSARIISKPMYRHKAYNIDINAAYPTCLLNSKLIDKKLYGRLMKLNKDERLASIGMMASRKRRFEIVEGEATGYIDDESIHAKYFFHCVNTISNLIWQCEIISGMDFIASWVDGLYTTTKKSAENCRKLLSDAGYKSTVTEVIDFQYTPHETRIVITYTKGKDNKLINIPIENNKLAQILKYIHSPKLKTDETLQSKN